MNSDYFNKISSILSKKNIRIPPADKPGAEREVATIANNIGITYGDIMEYLQLIGWGSHLNNENV